MSELKRFESLLAQGKISRRRFLEGVSILGLSAALSPMLLPQVAQAAPKKGGILRIGSTGGSTTDSLDPATLSATMAISISFGQLRNCLIELDKNGKAIPELAESFEATPDAKKWTFKLRKGIEFHNGKTLDADDVIFSINHHRGEKSKSAAKVIVNQIEELKADGKHTINVTLKEGNADFAFLMSDYHLSIMPNGTTNFDEGIGSGPYMLEAWEPGISASTKRNPNYWKEGRAHFDQIKTLSIEEPTSRTNALKTGEVDIIDKVDPKIAHLIDKIPGLKLISVPGNQHYTMPMLTDQEPFTNMDVRLALKYAIDRDDMVNKLLRGYGTKGNDHPIGPNYRSHDAELPQREYDPDKAKFHIKKAGLQNHTFQLHAADAAFPGGVDAAVLYKEHAAKCGINIEVVRVPNDGYWSDVWKKKSWCEFYWNGRATEDWHFSTAYAADAKWNDTHWKHERFNKLLKEARIELDEQKRNEMYAEMQKIVRDEGGVVLPMWANYLYGATSKLKYDSFSGQLPYDSQKGVERWWFDS